MKPLAMTVAAAMKSAVSNRVISHMVRLDGSEIYSKLRTETLTNSYSCVSPLD